MPSSTDYARTPRRHRLGVLLILLLSLQGNSSYAEDTPFQLTELHALHCLHQTLQSEPVPQTKPPECAHVLASHIGRPLAILRSDYRTEDNRSASLWVEALYAANVAQHSALMVRKAFTLQLEVDTGQLMAELLDSSVDTRLSVSDGMNEWRATSRLKELAIRWLLALEKTAPVDGLLSSHPAFHQLTLLTGQGETLNSQESIRNWLLERHQSFVRYQQSLQSLTVSRSDAGVFEVRASVRWEARDPHQRVLGQRLYVFEVSLPQSGLAQIRRISETDTLPLPHMGAQNFC